MNNIEYRLLKKLVKEMTSYFPSGKRKTEKDIPIHIINKENNYDAERINLINKLLGD